MRKQPIWIFSGFLLVLIGISLGIVMTHQWMHQLPSRSFAANTAVKFLSNLGHDDLSKIESQQLMAGDFTPIQGRWRSRLTDAQKLKNQTAEMTAEAQDDEGGVQFRIENNSLWIGSQRYYLAVTGKTDQGAIYFKRPENDKAAPLIFYPKGQHIPILQANGKIDRSGKSDPSDASQNRLLLAQTPLSAKQVARLVTYQND